MKRIIPLIVLSCVLCLLAACGPQGTTSSNADSSSPEDSAADSSSSLPADVSEIKLNDEEFEYHGVHLRLPNSVVLSEPSENQIISTSNSDKPITSEIWFDADVFATDDIVGKVEAIDEEYNPIQAMLIYGLYSSDDPDQEVVNIAGTYASVWKHSTDTHENMTSVQLILKSDIVTIEFADENGNCGDIIQESIDTIRVDEDEIPDFVKSLRPEALKEAHLHEEAWRIGGEYAVYLNMPEDYSPVIGDDGELSWVSSDGSTKVYAEEEDPSFLDNDESDIETMLEGTPGLEMREFYGAGTYHSMYVLDYLCEDTANNQWVYQLYVQPFKYSNNIGNVIPGIVITAVGPDKDEVQLEDAFAALRYADGFSHNGILDVDAVATQES